MLLIEFILILNKNRLSRLKNISNATTKSNKLEKQQKSHWIYALFYVVTSAIQSFMIDFAVYFFYALIVFDSIVQIKVLFTSTSQVDDFGKSL